MEAYNLLEEEYTDIQRAYHKLNICISLFFERQVDLEKLYSAFVEFINCFTSLSLKYSLGSAACAFDTKTLRGIKVTEISRRSLSPDTLKSLLNYELYSRLLTKITPAYVSLFEEVMDQVEEERPTFFKEVDHPLYLLSPSTSEILFFEVY